MYGSFFGHLKTGCFYLDSLKTAIFILSGVEAMHSIKKRQIDLETCLSKIKKVHPLNI